jgi:hypothetical protein
LKNGDGDGTREAFVDGSSDGGICVDAGFECTRADREPDTRPGRHANTGQRGMLTIFFKHDETRPLGELNAQLEKQGFYKAFPPEGVEVVSWYVMMGVGQVVTLRLPASRLREVNRIIEISAWGAYHTEFYPTYDYKPTGVANHEKAK